MVTACVFDAYGTLFNVGGITQHANNSVGDRAQALADLWRRKQLEYTWLRSLSGSYVDFWKITGDALDFAMESLHIAGEGLRDELMNRYLSVPVYPEVSGTLKALKARGIRLAILSNGTSEMLLSAVANARLEDVFDAVLSVDELGVFKPHPSVYQLAVDRLGVPPEKIYFTSSNGWDAFPAKAFGFHVFWCNRSAQVTERLPSMPDAEIADLSELPARLLA